MLSHASDIRHFYALGAAACLGHGSYIPLGHCMLQLANMLRSVENVKDTGQHGAVNSTRVIGRLRTV